MFKSILLVASTACVCVVSGRPLTQGGDDSFGPPTSNSTGSGSAPPMPGSGSAATDGSDFDHHHSGSEFDQHHSGSGSVTGPWAHHGSGSVQWADCLATHCPDAFATCGEDEVCKGWYETTMQSTAEPTLEEAKAKDNAFVVDLFMCYDEHCHCPNATSGSGSEQHHSGSDFDHHHSGSGDHHTSGSSLGDDDDYVDVEDFGPPTSGGSASSSSSTSSTSTSTGSSNAFSSSTTSSSTGAPLIEASTTDDATPVTSKTAEPTVDDDGNGRLCNGLPCADPDGEKEETDDGNIFPEAEGGGGGVVVLGQGGDTQAAAEGEKTGGALKEAANANTDTATTGTGKGIADRSALDADSKAAAGAASAGSIVAALCALLILVGAVMFYKRRTEATPTKTVDALVVTVPTGSGGGGGGGSIRLQAGLENPMYAEMSTTITVATIDHGPVYAAAAASPVDAAVESEWVETSRPLTAVRGSVYNQKNSDGTYYVQPPTTAEASIMGVYSALATEPAPVYAAAQDQLEADPMYAEVDVTTTPRAALYAGYTPGAADYAATDMSPV